MACYICRDPEFAQMGLPLCMECTGCKTEGRGQGHVPADDTMCSVCGWDEQYQQYPPKTFGPDGRYHE